MRELLKLGLGQAGEEKAVTCRLCEADPQPTSVSVSEALSLRPGTAAATCGRVMPPCVQLLFLRVAHSGRMAVSSKQHGDHSTHFTDYRINISLCQRWNTKKTKPWLLLGIPPHPPLARETGREALATIWSRCTITEHTRITMSCCKLIKKEI